MKTLSKLWIVFAVLAVAIPCVMFKQFNQGLEVTGLNHQVVWGLYIAGFTTCLAIATGLLVFVGISGFKGISAKVHFVASAAALGFLFAAGVLILADLGKPERFWMILISWQTDSPLWWDCIAMNALIGAAFVQSSIGALKMLRKEDRLWSNHIVNTIGVVVPLGLFVITTHVFSDMSAARPAWATPIIPFAFISSALTGGAVIFAFLNVDDDETIVEKLIAPLIIINIVFAAILHSQSVPVGTYNAQPYMTTGFWTVLALGNLAPLALYFVGKKNSIAMGAAVILILIGLVVKKLDFIIPSYTANNFAYPGGAVYTATFAEIMLTVGAFAMALAFTGFVIMGTDFLKWVTSK